MSVIITGSLFYLFTFVLILASVMVISVKNPVHSVLSLILAFFATAGLFILIGAEFLAMVVLIVYVGAVAVLFLFVVMMLNINFAKLKENFNQHLALCILISGVLLLDLLISLKYSINNFSIRIPELTNQTIHAKTNTHAIGKVLYTEYFYAFQISGIILLVAMVGCIALTLRQRLGVKKQKIAQQLARDPKSSIEVIHVETGAGIGGKN